MDDAHGDDSKKSCFDLTVVKTRHRRGGEDNEKHQEWHANRLDGEPNAHWAVDDKPHEQGEDERESYVGRSRAASLVGLPAGEPRCEDECGSDSHLEGTDRASHRSAPRNGPNEQTRRRYVCTVTVNRRWRRQGCAPCGSRG